MCILCRQRWVLWRLSRSLRRSDPHLATMLAIFAGLPPVRRSEAGNRHLRWAVGCASACPGWAAAQ